MADSTPSLLLADQRRQWESGNPVRVESYLERDPSLRDSGDVLLDLIYHEVVLREAAGESPTLGEYQARFPSLGPALQDQFEVHAALEGPRRTRRRSPERVPSIPGFTDLKKLGSGGMGVVYKGRQQRLGREVAVKVIRDWATADPDELVRFRKEAEAVARISHPNVVAIHGVGDRNGCPYLILEFVDGGSLDRLTRGRPQPARAAAGLVAVLARAADHLHRQGIVHCDLKPANVLLARSDPPAGVELGTLADSRRFVPKIADFGFARRLDAEAASRSGRSLGTPQYMAPEQVSGPHRRIGPAADVHALGAILYELLVGRPPHLGADLMDVLKQVQFIDPVSPRRLVPSVPRDLETVCLRCLHKDPARRYATAAALAEDLDRYLAGRPVFARPVGPTDRAWRWCRRNPVVAGLAVALVAAVAAGFTVVTAKMLEARQERNDKETARRGEKTRGDELAETLRNLEAITHRTRIAAADRERHANNIDGANRLLDECRPELRGFEWHLLKRLSAGPQRTARTGHDFTTLVAISGNQRVVAALGGSDERGGNPGRRPQSIVLLDARTGAVLRTLPGNATSFPQALALGPDGRRLAVARSDDTVEVWDTETGQPVWSNKTNRRVYDVAFRSADELLTASGALTDRMPAVGGTTDAEFRTWDVGTGRVVRTVAGARQQDPAGGRLSRDGRRFACWSHDLGETGAAGVPVVVYDPATGKPVRSLSGHSSPVRAVALTPDGSVVAIGDGNAVRLWDAADGKSLGTLTVPNGMVAAVALGSNGKTVALAGRDGAVRTWDVRTGQIEAYQGHSNGVADVLFLPGDQGMLSAGEDGTVRWWDATATAVRLTLTHGVSSVAAAGNTFCTAAAVPGAGTIRLIDPAARTNQVVPTPAADLAIRPDGAVFAAGAVEEAPSPKDVVYGTRLWDTATGQAKGFVPWAMTPLAFTPDGRSLIAVRGRSVTKKGQPVRVQVMNPDDPGAGPQILTREGPLVTVIERDAVGVFDAESGAEQFALSGHAGGIRVAGVAAGKSLAAADAAEVIVWDLATRAIRSRFPVNPQPVAIAFRPDEGQLATAGPNDRTIAVRDPATGQAAYTLKLDANVKALAFSPDSRLLVAGCQDGSVRLWEAATGQLLLTLTELRYPVRSLAFGGNGQWLVAGSGSLSTQPGGEVVVWDARPKPEP